MQRGLLSGSEPKIPNAMSQSNPERTCSWISTECIVLLVDRLHPWPRGEVYDGPFDVEWRALSF